jgi:hypothetical protein
VDGAKVCHVRSRITRRAEIAKRGFGGQVGG